MITPQDIKKQSLSWWKELLLSITTGESFFPKEISRIGKITAKDILLKLTEYKASIAELQKGASLWGYTVEMTEKSFEKIGIQNIPTCIQIPSLEIYLHITRKRNELDIFIRNWQLITNEMPQLIEWSQRNPLRLISHDTWRDTIKVCKYFTEHPRPHLYIRELPIEVHTKYIEENKDLLKSLLDELLPASTITLNEKTFEKRYGLKCAEPLIRIRFLDSTCFSPLSAFAGSSLLPHPTAIPATIPTIASVAINFFNFIPLISFCLFQYSVSLLHRTYHIEGM